MIAYITAWFWCRQACVGLTSRLIMHIPFCIAYAFIFICLTSVTLLCVILPCPLLVSCLQTSSSWTWSFGWRVPQQQSPLALWWPFWLCGLESQCPSPSLAPTSDLRSLWVRPTSLLICQSLNDWEFVLIMLSLLLCRQSSNRCEQTRFPVKFLSSRSLRSLFPVSLWVVSCPSAASSFSFSSSSTAFGRNVVWSD